MARVFLDVNVFSESWFAPILRELVGAREVLFVYSPVKKLDGELARAVKLAEFLKIASSMNKVVVADPDETQAHMDYLEAQDRWGAEAACDDPHIFAIVYVRGVRFVFSMDRRIARCRGTINQAIDARYCGFIVIDREVTYRAHRASILS